MNVVSEDTDFGELLARQRAVAPSFVLLRTNGPMPPDDHALLLLATTERVRQRATTLRIVEAGTMSDGTLLTLRAYTELPTETRETVAQWVASDSRRGQAQWVNSAAKPYKICECRCGAPGWRTTRLGAGDPT